MLTRIYTSVLVMGLSILWTFPAYGEGQGSVFVEISDALQHDIPGRLDLIPAGGGKRLQFWLKDGKATETCPPGSYNAYVYAYDWDIPILVNVQHITVEAGATTTVVADVVEGTASERKLRAFDRDHDLVLDRVEIQCGTNPDDPTSYPGAEPVPMDSTVLSKEGAWYKGDFHVHSKYGAGTESVAELVARAEKEGLDFIAITDRNTMDAALDPAFTSKKVVVIPAMEWGSDERGVALIYGPRTFPELTNDLRDDQGVLQRVQAQGGVYAIAHPCFAMGPWQRGLSYVNAVEVWTRSWREIPPITLDKFMEEYKRRDNGKLMYSISRAVSVQDLSANGQAAMFWDYELTRGLKAAAIGGSMSSSPKVPMGRPITYVYAPEKSVNGILYGLRNGYTWVSSGPDGPTIRFTADAGKDGKIDVNIGGVVPLAVETAFWVQIKNGKGMKAQVLRNGWPILSKNIETDKVQVLTLTDKSPSYAIYRVCVVKPSAEPGYGPMDMMAMTSPIYAQDIVPIDERKKDPFNMWVKLENKTTPPVEVTAKKEENGKVYVRTDGGPKESPLANTGGEFTPPKGDEVRTINPTPLK